MKNCYIVYKWMGGGALVLLLILGFLCPIVVQAKDVIIPDSFFKNSLTSFYFANTAPEPVTFIKPDWISFEPDWSDFADESYMISWLDQDVDDDANITLFYDDDQQFDNGHLGIIAMDISEDADEDHTEYVWNTGQIAEGFYEWDTTAIANGEYYIGAIISDTVSSVLSYSSGKVRVYHFPKISKPSSMAGLANVWGGGIVDNPQLKHQHAFFTWDKLEPCGDDTYSWEINPETGGYYRDSDKDGVCESGEELTYDAFKETFMKLLYRKVIPSCSSNCEFKQPLELLNPDIGVYIHINGPSERTLKYNSSTGKYQKRDYWLFDHVALLRTPDGDYNVNGRAYPSVQFWDPRYQYFYQDLLQDFATRLKQYPEIYPYITFVRAQFNAFNAESGYPSASGAQQQLCSSFASLGECVDYVYDYHHYDSGIRYNVSLAKTYYYDEQNQLNYYYEDANAYHAWVAETYTDIFHNDPLEMLQAEITLKPFVTDGYFTPELVRDSFLYQMVYEHDVWFYVTNMRATGHALDSTYKMLVHDEKIARGYTEPVATYSVLSDPINIVPAQYNNALQWVYWHALLDLHLGTDITSYYRDILLKCRPGYDETYCDIFEFLNQYAGQKFNFAHSPGGWIAFRSLFHPEQLSGNLEMHIRQLDADATSNRLFGYDSCAGDSDCSTAVNLNPPKPNYVDCSTQYCPDDGYFGSVRNGRVTNLGPKSQPFGIWARSIGRDGKDVITLDVVDEFAQSFFQPWWGIKVNVIYRDRGSDTFTIKYLNRSGAAVQHVINKTHSQKWQGITSEEAIVIEDFVFNNALNGGDLQLLSNQDGEDIFHMLLIEPFERIDLTKSAKHSSNNAPKTGEILTYTISIHNEGIPFTGTIQLTDTIPAGLVYVPGSLTAAVGMPDDSANPILTWSGSLNGASSIKMTYAVTVTETSIRAIRNTVFFKPELLAGFSRSAEVIANGYTMYFPVCSR